MASNLSGEFAALAKVIKSLGTIAKDSIPTIAIKGAVELNKVVEIQFSQGVDPDGRSWTDLKASTLKKGRKPPPLTASGRMRRTARAVPSAKKITEKIPFPAPIHQAGSANMAARRMVPVGNFLPRSWSEPLERVGVEVISSRLKK
jgi:hypothetical protein